MDSRNSKDLLKLEADELNGSAASRLESKLLLFKDKNISCSSAVPADKPTSFHVPKSQVLSQVKDFLGIISESNKKLEQDAKENPSNYNIEVLSGSESEYIEMDLMLGIADLHTPEAVAVAEATLAGGSLCKSSSDSDLEDEGSYDEDDSETEGTVKEHSKSSGLKSIRLSKTGDVQCGDRGRKKRKRCPNIIELS